MPSIKCRCDEVIHYGEIPCPHEWLLISDVAFSHLSGEVNAEEVYREMTSALRCPRCGRLWIFWAGYTGEPAEYVPEELRVSRA